MAQPIWMVFPPSLRVEAKTADDECRDERSFVCSDQVKGTLLAPPWMFQVVTISWFIFTLLSSLVFFIRLYISCHENGPSTDYSNHPFHNYAGIAQACSQQRHFAYKVCVGVSSVCYFPVQLSWSGHRPGPCADVSSSYLTTCFFQIHNRRWKSIAAHACVRHQSVPFAVATSVPVPLHGAVLPRCTHLNTLRLL